jgi:hypothetical protein
MLITDALLCCRLWQARPLDPMLLQYAADDVRFLLPLAHRLRADMPDAAWLLQLVSKPAVAGTFPGSDSLQLPVTRRNAAALTELLSMGSSSLGSSSSSWPSAIPGFSTDLQLQLQLYDNILPRYSLVMDSTSAEDAPSSSSTTMSHTADSAAESPEVVHSSADSAACLLEPNGAAVDDAVLSMAALLPGNLQQYLEPYLLADSEPALQEVVLDQGRPVELRLSRGRPVQLPVACSVAEALQCLAVAKERLLAAGDVGIGSSADRPGVLASQQSSSTAAGDAADVVLYLMGCTPPEAPFLAAGSGPLSNSRPTSSSMLTQVPDIHGACLFNTDNRMALPGQLHRISAMRDASGVYGLTYRIGRHVPGAAAGIKDVLWQMAANHRCVRR